MPGPSLNRDELNNRMGYHKMSDPAMIDAMAQLRERCIDVGEFIVQLNGDPRSTAVAITHLEDALMWGVKAMALEAPLDLGN